jgi:hypothetical protein
MLLYKTATKCLWRKPYQDILFIYRQIWLGPVHDILSNRKDSILLCHLWRKPYQDILFIYRQIRLGTVHDILSNRKVYILLCRYRRQQQNVYDENHTRTFYLFIDKFDWGQYMTYYQIEKFSYYYVTIEGSNKIFMTKTIPGHFIYL